MTTLAYSKRVSKAHSGFLRMRVEASLFDKLLDLQANPRLTVKNDLRPSKSVLVRRAIQRYAADIAAMDDSAIESELLAIHRLI